MADAVFESNVLPVPSNITINGQNEADDLATRSTGQVDIGFVLRQALAANDGHRTRAVFQISTDDFVTSFTLASDWYTFPIFLPADDRIHMTWRGLAQNTKYRVRARSETKNPGAISSKFNSFEFWTNRAPNVPPLIGPAENSTFTRAVSVPFDWQFSDPDPGDKQSRFELRWRFLGIDQTTVVSDWQTTSGSGTATTLAVPGTNFQANRVYEWQVRVADSEGLFSEWSLVRSFFVRDLTSPPLLLSPLNDTAVDVVVPVIFDWRFRDPDSGDTQVKADLRYRVVGTPDWTLLSTVATTTARFQMAANVLLPNFHYEWQVETYDAGGGGALVSDWSESGTFYSIRTPGELAPATPLGDTTVRGALGCGHHRVFVYQQGGQVPLGEITQIEQVIWRRHRDDLSNCVVDTTGFDYDCGVLLASLRSWQHELVVFRDDQRVWEGPITRLTYTDAKVEVEAKDVMGYLYRRIMRQGYNDSYNCRQYDAYGNCVEQLGLNTVVYRAARTIIDALGRGDPNVLPYLTAINNSNDSRQSRIVPDFAKTAWEEVDDLAATAGLDYVTVGRRIILFDTHYPIGKLPEMRDGDFTDPVIVTEYGMNLCNYYGVTDGTGLWGAAVPLGRTFEDYAEFYGPIELLSSSYGDASATPPSTTAEAETLRRQYASQAQRNISHRWPSPVVVRVPDNTSINPEANLDINHLIPGVWIPLRATEGLREVSQWQKLDLLTVTETENGETVQVTMSPAPNGGMDDPDALGQIGES